MRAINLNTPWCNPKHLMIFVILNYPFVYLTVHKSSISLLKASLSNMGKFPSWITCFLSNFSIHKQFTRIRQPNSWYIASAEIYILPGSLFGGKISNSVSPGPGVSANGASSTNVRPKWWHCCVSYLWTLGWEKYWKL